MKTSAMNITSFELIKILRDKVGEEQAAALTNYVETKVHEEFESKKEGFATKEDIVRLQGFLETKIESAKVQMIIWTITTMIASLALFTGIILKFLK